MKNLIPLIILILMIKTTTFSQVSINTDGSRPDASAMLDVKSIDKGLLIPRMSTAQRMSIISPVDGLMVYDTDLGSLCFYRMGSWNQSLSSTTGWSLQGNAGIDHATDFLGTIDSSALVFKYNNSSSGRIDSTLTFFGNAAGHINAGSFSTLVGSGAGMKVISGNSNTAFGYRALFNSTSGSNNTAVGSEAGIGITTGSNNIAIGYMADVPYDTASNQMVIGSSDLLYGDLENNRIGIGTITPRQQLEMTGNFVLPATTDSSGIIYRDSVPWLHNFKKDGTTGHNLFIGDNAGNFTLTGATGFDGSWLIGIGDSVLINNTTGKINIGIGYDALRDNTTGERNVAVGAESMSNNKHGYGNTAVGFRALLYGDSTVTNVAVGQCALMNLRGLGSCNDAVGAGALQGLIWGDDNIGFGSGALITMDSGYANIAIGTYAMFQKDWGARNTVIGNYSMYHNLRGERNTALGAWSGYENVTGTGNIFLGDGAGYWESGSNKLYISNDTTHSPLIYGDFEKDTVKIFGVLKTRDNITTTSDLYSSDIENSGLITNKDYKGSGYFSLPETSSYSVGVIRTGSNRFIHNYKPFENDGFNTFMGIEAGNFTMESGTASQASHNTGMGSRTLNALTTGYSNTGVGSLSLISNTTGYKNTASGHGALYHNVSGYNNTSIGFQALFNNNSYNNTALGVNSLFLTASGANNTAIGTHSGFSNVTGTKNVYLGFYTGFGAIGSGNVFLGYRAGYNETGSNKLYIDNDSICKPLIWGDFANDSIRINGNLSGTEHFNLTGNIYCNEVIASANLNSKDFIGSGFINLPNTVSDSTGVIRKDGVRYIHNYNSQGNDGRNTFIGIDAGNFTMTGPDAEDASYNTGLGYQVLTANTSGAYNTAVGSGALQSNSSGSGNVMLGYMAGSAIAAGDYNIAIGSEALYTVTTGAFNIAVGYSSGCLANDTNTISIGHQAHADASNQVRLGNSAITSLYCQGAYFGTIGSNNVDLFADSDGKIGYVASSARYKDNISAMEDVNWIYALRPVNFTYKSDELKKKQYGLIAEEVEKINPDFVHYNSNGQVETVSYNQLITPMVKVIQEHKITIEELKSDIDIMKAEREILLRNQEMLLLRLEALEKEREGLSQK